MADSKRVTLGYWNVRGVSLCFIIISNDKSPQLGQPIRLMLKYTGTEFNDVQYDERNRE